MCQLLKRSLFLPLFIASSLFFSLASFASFDPGTYSGVIHPKSGADIPIDFSFTYSSRYVDGNDDELFSSKREIVGSFMVDGEGGPYGLRSVNYEFETGIVELRYYRDNSGGPASLLFTGTLKKGVVSGDVYSGLNREREKDGKFGTFEIKRNAPSVASVKDKYEGRFAGTFTYDRPPSTIPLLMSFDLSAGSPTNPADFELGYTPAHVGFYQMNTAEQAVHTIYIDYLRSQIFLTYAGPAGSITFVGTIATDGQSITGDARSSFGARIGTFQVKRLAGAGGIPE